MRKALFISTLLIVLWFVWMHFETKSESVALPVKADNRVIDSLRMQLQSTIDSLNSYKPTIEKAIERLKFYDSLYSHSSSNIKEPSDTLWIKRMRSDLYEARLEIRRLCAPRYYRVYFKSEKNEE